MRHLCLCGHHIEEIYVISREFNGDIVYCMIGSQCIRRTKNETLIDKLAKLKRTTVDCKYCRKKINKKIYDKHISCNRCGKETNCHYKHCYHCNILLKSNKECASCGKTINGIYRYCYACYKDNNKKFISMNRNSLLLKMFPDKA